MPISDFPRNCWYAAATSAEVGRDLIARRMLDTPVVLYRREDGTPVALEDRCAHRPYPLSLGRLDGDTIVSGYTGFVYGPDGEVVSVPTQARVPIGARVDCYPVHDDGSLVWVWLGEPSLAAQRPVPRLRWLSDPGWATFGDSWETAAPLTMLHENFADITHVAVVHPDIAPPVLRSVPPPLQVEVTETTVAFTRDYPPAPLPGWHAGLLGVAADAAFAQREEGMFVSPGVWKDRWDVLVDDTPATLRFTHALTPVDGGRTRHVWRVSRNFALDEATTEQIRPIFTEYYQRVRSILETMAAVVALDGARKEVSVSADAAAIAVRKILRRMVVDEIGS